MKLSPGDYQPFKMNTLNSEEYSDVEQDPQQVSFHFQHKSMSNSNIISNIDNKNDATFITSGMLSKDTSL